MPQKPGTFYRPDDLDEALSLLQKTGVVPLAGGTRLLASEAGLDVAAVVDLQDLGLDTIDGTAGGSQIIGAMVTLTDLAKEIERLGDAAPLVGKAIQQAGPNTYRNAATLGGVVAARLPDSELLAALQVLEATLIMRQPAESSVGVDNYLLPEEKPTGLITSIVLPAGSGRGHSERVARTPADYPIVSVTGWLPDSGSVRLAATGIGPRPQRLTAAETAASGGLSEATIAAAADKAQAVATHPGDFRGNAAYRAEMVAVLTRRVLEALAGN